MAKLDAELGFELLKLLVQMAWSDHQVSAEEGVYLLALTDRLCPAPPYKLHVQGWINGEEQLPPPNLGVLKEHRDLVMKAMAQVSLADGKVVQDERDMLAQVANMLAD
mgnify:CR=1 FL=1